MDGTRSLSGAAGGDRFMRQNPSEILAFLGSKSQQSASQPPSGAAPALSRNVPAFDLTEFPSLGGRQSSGLGGVSAMGLGGSSGMPPSVPSSGMGGVLPQSSSRGTFASDRGLYSDAFPSLPQARGGGGGLGSAPPLAAGSSLQQVAAAAAAAPPSSNPFTQAAKQQQQPHVGLLGGGGGGARHDLALAGSYGLMGLMGVIRMEDPDRGSLALGTDLTTLGLNLNSSENLHTIFPGPWKEDTPRDSLFSLPHSYPRKVSVRPENFEKLALDTLFACFYSMPRDVLQILAAQELVNRGWGYHEESRLWFYLPKNGSVMLFDVNQWECRNFPNRLPEGFEAGFLALDKIKAAAAQALSQHAKQQQQSNVHAS